MAKFRFTGISAYVDKLEKLGGKEAQGVIKYAIYPGAGIVADAVREEIEMHHSRSGDLANSIGLSTMRTKRGFTYTTLGFDGYDREGVPNALKARVLESGNSQGAPATHFISKTIRRVEAQAVQAMSEALDEKINEIMGD